jgi:hypothetical protein
VQGRGWDEEEFGGAWGANREGGSLRFFACLAALFPFRS